MRTEELINEAKGFNRDKSAYIHVELFDGQRGAAIVAGDETAVVLAIYNAMEAFAQTRSTDFRGMLKEMRKVFKAIKRLYRLTVTLKTPMFAKVTVDAD